MAHAKAALVTGSSRGIGRAIATRLGADGMNVVVNYRVDRDAADEVVAAIEASGSHACAVRADVSDPGQVRDMFDAAEKRFGALDVLVGNVGVARHSPIADATDEDYDVIFSTNTRATFVALREAANRLRDGGRIVVISSGAAVTNRPRSGLYAASKAAGDTLVRVLAQELGPRGVTVNSVLPGPTRTDALATGGVARMAEELAVRTPLGRLGEPDDIAEIVAFLVAASGRWITGQAIHAGGGLF